MGARHRRRLSQTRALRVLKEVAEALNSATTEQRATGEALSRMADLLGVETGWVWLRDPASDRFYNAAVQSLPPYLQEPVRMTGRSCWCLELFRKGQLTARNIDVVECSRLAPAVTSHETASTHGLRCHASVPLYAGDRPLGVMNLAMRGWRRLTRIWDEELAAEGVHFLSIDPGDMDTPLHALAVPDADPSTLKRPEAAARELADAIAAVLVPAAAAEAAR